MLIVFSLNFLWDNQVTSGKFSYITHPRISFKISLIITRNRNTPSNHFTNKTWKPYKHFEISFDSILKTIFLKHVLCYCFTNGVFAWFKILRKSLAWSAGNITRLSSRLRAYKSGGIDKFKGLKCELCNNIHPLSKH